MEVLIGVPVRDEERGLPDLLGSLEHQVVPDDWTVTTHLYFDGCLDSSAEIAQQFFESERLSGSCKIGDRSNEPNAGAARKAALQLALDNVSRPGALLLTTDADTVPEQDWVSCAASELAQVDVVAGYTVRDATTSIMSRDRLECYLERLHAFRRSVDPIDYDHAPSHPWVGGANLGMSRRAYETLGGFRAICTGEDADFVDRARHAGLRVRHSRDMRVTTSSRTVGRAKGGLADALKHMRDEQNEPRVEHPEDAAQQYARHALARRIFLLSTDDVDWSAISRTLGFPACDLEDLARTVPNAEAFVMKAVPARVTGRDLPLSKASDILDQLSPDRFHG